MKESEMMNERSDLPEVLAPAPRSPAQDQTDEKSVEGVDGDQDPDEAMNAWFRAAEGLVMAYWHDPRTAIKYAVAILQLLQRGLTEKEILAIDPTTIPPITEIEAGWR